MNRGRSVFLVLALLSTPSMAHAQAREAFVRALVEFVNAAGGATDEEGPALRSAAAAMDAAIAEWDAGIARVEAGLKAEIGGAPPQTAARMRATLGAVLLDQARIAEAIGQFELAAKLDPQRVEIHLVRGLLYSLANRPADAAAAYRLAWNREPARVDTSYFFLRSSPAAAPADVDAALKTLTSALGRATGSAELVPAFAVPSLLDEASLSAPVFVGAAFVPAVRLLEQGRYRQAVVRLLEIVKADPLVTGSRSPRDERTWLAAADLRYGAGDAVGAVEALRDAVRAVPESGLAYWKLGRLLAMLGDQDGALPAFEKAASIPSLGGAALVHAEVGRLHHTRLDLDAAAAAYARRVRLMPNDPAAHFDLGEIYRAQDKLADALAEYLAAALLDPASAQAFAAIGLVHVSAGREADAVPMLRKAVTLDPAHLQARYGLSRALMRVGKAEEARQQLEAFEQLQAKAMEEERRRFRENQTKIDATLGR